MQLAVTSRTKYHKNSFASTGIWTQDPPVTGVFLPVHLSNHSLYPYWKPCIGHKNNSVVTGNNTKCLYIQ